MKGLTKRARLHSATGELIPAFARMEGLLSLNLIILSQDLGAPVVSGGLELSRRLGYFRQSLSIDRVPVPAQSMGFRLADRIAAVSDIRHACSHGSCIDDNDGSDPLGVTFLMLDPSRPTAPRVFKHMFIGDIEKAAQESYRVAEGLYDLARLLRPA